MGNEGLRLLGVNIFDAAYLVGRKVVDEIIENWGVYRNTNPIVP